MIRFLVDADLPRGVCTGLRERGYLADDVRDLGLRAASDDAVLQYAIRHGYTLISGDKGFANILRFPLGTHLGIVVVRFPRHTPARAKSRVILRWMPTIRQADVKGNLIIVEPKGIRIRRVKER